jgi:hypothetical protein
MSDRHRLQSFSQSTLTRASFLKESRSCQPYILLKEVYPMATQRLLLKKYLTIVIALLSVVGVVTGVVVERRNNQGMSVHFNKRDLPNDGIRILTSADPEFEAVGGNYFASKSSNSNESLKPFSVFIENIGTRTIVAYMLVWQMVKIDGQVLTNTTSYSEPGILMGNEIPNDPRFKHTQAIEPGAVRCFTWSAQVSPEGGQPLGGSNTMPLDQIKRVRDQLTDELSQASDLTVSLDGVFFDDGEFVGPNATGFFERIQAMVKAKRDLRRDIALASDKGKLEEAFDQVAAKGLSPAIDLTSESSPDDYYKHYTKLFAEEIDNMQKSYGKQRLAEYLVKLHKKPHPLLKKK